MLTAIANAFRVPELRRKILFTLAIIALYRVGSYIPVPGVDTTVIQSQVEGTATLGLLNLFSGGALEKFAVFSLGIMPYITSSIIMQLLQGVIPKVEQWSKEGEAGQRKITQVTRYLTLGIATMSSLGLLTLFRSVPGALPTSGPGLPPFWFTSLVIVTSLIAGTALIMWFGELITQRGIGNGMSLIIFTSIVSRFPVAIVQSVQFGNWAFTLLMIAIVLFIIAAIVTMERAQRRIPVQYAKRVVGRKVYGGSGTYIPLKINGANVVPIIFASAILFFPTQLAQLVPNPPTWLTNAANALASGPGELDARVHPHRVLHLLLHGSDLQPDRPVRQPAQERWLHPRRTPGPCDRALHRERAQPDHASRRAVPRCDRGRTVDACSRRPKASWCSSSVVRRSSSWWVSRWRR